MPKVPAPAAPVNQSPRPRLARRMLRHGYLAAVVIAVLAVTTGAAAGPNASRPELIVYSVGSFLAIITVIRIVIKLFWYILKTLAIAAILLTVYVVAIHAIHALQAILGT